MQISFNGVLKPYVYNCPWAFKLRNKDKIYPERKEEVKEQEGPKAQLRRDFGIEQHDLASAYIKSETDEYEFATPLIDWFRDQDNVETEVTEFFSLDLEYLGHTKPAEGDFISCRKDAVVRQTHKHTVLDLKYGNEEYNTAVYYDETDFFIMLEAARFYEVEQYETVIHFPVSGYSLPRRKYTATQINRLQTKYLQRIDRIVNDKYCVPSPSKAHCIYCDYRSADAGGCGACEYSIL